MIYIIPLYNIFRFMIQKLLKNRPAAFLIGLVAIILLISLMYKFYVMYMNHQLQEAFATKDQLEQRLMKLEELMETHTHDLPSKTGKNSNALVETLEEDTPAP